MIEKYLLNPGGMIWLFGVYSVICLLLLSRIIKVFYRRYNKVTDEEILEILHSPFIPKVSLIIHEQCLPSIERLYSLLSLQYGNYELILVVSSGNKMLKDLNKEFLLKRDARRPAVIPVQSESKLYRSDRPGYRKLIVVEHKWENLGEALNAGLNASSGQYVSVLSKPGFIYRDSLVKLLRPFLENSTGLIASAGAVRIRPVDSLSSSHALKTIRNFVLHGAGWTPVVAIEAFCEGIGMLSSKDVIIAGGFDSTEKDPVRTLLYKLTAIQFDKNKKPGMVYLPEVLVQVETKSTSGFRIAEQITSYFKNIKERFSLRRVAFMLPVIFPGIPYFMLILLMIFLMFFGPLTGKVSVTGSIAYFVAGYTFIVSSSLLALFIELRFSTLKYSKREIKTLIGASFVLPFKLHFPGKS